MGLKRKEREKKVGLGERRRKGLLVSPGDKFRPHRDRTLPGREIAQRFWVLGSGRALCHNTTYLRVATSQDTQGHITRAFWVQTQQDRRSWSQVQMAQGPCAKPSVSSASHLQSH